MRKKLMTDESIQPEDAGIIGMKALVEDLVLTDAFLIKGKVEGKFGRLSKVLEHYEKRFLVISAATMIDLRCGDVIHTPRVHVNVDELVLLHEFVDAGGDMYLQNLSDKGKNTRIRAFVHGVVNLELAGMIRSGAYETAGLDRGRFFVMEDCSVRGLEEGLERDFSLLSKMSYAIVNSRKIAYIYDFS
jgi:hypothetical protein